MVDSSHEKEARAKETISALKTEIANLSRLVEQGAGLSVGQENTVNALLKEKEELSADRDRQVEEIAQLKAEISEHLQLMRAKEAEREGARQQVHDVKEQIGVRKAEGEREVRAREKLEKERKELNVVLDMRAADIKVRYGAPTRCGRSSHEMRPELARDAAGAHATEPSCLRPPHTLAQMCSPPTYQESTRLAAPALRQACNSTNEQLRLNRERAEDLAKVQKTHTERVSRDLETASARKVRAEQEVRVQTEVNATQQRTNDEVSEELRSQASALPLVARDESHLRSLTSGASPLEPHIRSR